MSSLARAFIIGVLLTESSGPAAGQALTDQLLTAEEVTVLAAAEAAVQLGRQFPDSIWPGYYLDQVPMIVYVPERWALLLNAPPTATGFTDYPDSWPHLPTHALYHPGQYRELAGQLAFDLQVDSITAAAVGFTGQDARGFLEYVVHENFHQYQHAVFGEIQWEREELYPIEDVTNTSLACLEVYLLRDAVVFLEQAQEDSARNRVAQFVAVRSHRWGRADPYVARYEQGQEINEGTARYVEMRASGLAPKLQHSLSPRCAAILLAADRAPIPMPKNLIEGLGGLVIANTVAPEDMSRNRIYPVGAAQGYLLDHLGVDWKGAAQRAGPEFTFAALLSESVGSDSSQVTTLVAEAKALFDYETIYRESAYSIAAHRAGFDSAVAIFESQPGIRVEIHLSAKNLTRSRSSSSRKWLVDKGSREFRDHYDVYVLQSRPDQEFAFQLKETGLLEETDWSTKDKKLTFYCPQIEFLSVNGIPQTDARDGDFSFEKLELTGANFELKAIRSGSVSMSANLLEVDLLP